ncbi:MAG: cell division protein FtsK, partial [Ilumatobacteraceae bacterium]|nr:cell division protein FtsK [Ilumatobacteraceae bacterium]
PPPGPSRGAASTTRSGARKLAPVTARADRPGRALRVHRTDGRLDLTPPPPGTLSPEATKVHATQHALLAAIKHGRDEVAARCSAREHELHALSERITALGNYAASTENTVKSVASSGKKSASALRSAREQAGTSAAAVDAEWVPAPDPDAAAAGRGHVVIDPSVIAAAQALQNAGNEARSRMTRGMFAAATAKPELVRILVKLIQIGHGASQQAAMLSAHRDALQQYHDQTVQTAAAQLEAAVTALHRSARAATDACPPPARRGWNPADWNGWTPSDAVTPVHLGTLTSPREDAMREFSGLPSDVIGLTQDMRLVGGIRLEHDTAHKPQALSAARSLVARLLASTPPGKSRFTFFDPLGLGEAVAPFLALADHDPKLIDSKVWSAQDGLRSRLEDYTAHIEVVIQKYLRGEYDSIEDFNIEAGEIAEPYRFLFVFDFPSQFDEPSMHQLCRIIENGPRCGVYTVVLANRDVPAAHGVSIAGLPNTMVGLPGDSAIALNLSSSERVVQNFAFDADPIATLGPERGQDVIDSIVDAVGRAGRGADNVKVDLGRTLDLHGEAVRSGVRADLPGGSQPADIDEPRTWWRNSTIDAVAGPIGQSGARDAAMLRLDSEILSGVLLVGRPGAGKSTLLHSYIGGLTTLYSPEELELYLIDFREGVEFKAYAEHGLPHARCVAVQSEREFGVSVLESIVIEMRRRAELIRATGGAQTSFRRLRESLGTPLPRVVLVFDEFHVLFAESDKIGARASDLLETIIRQGRGFGVHVVLGSQSLAGLDALGRHVLQLLPIRILLPSSEADAATVLGEGNDAWRLLSRRGEGILNNSGGASEGNVPFQAAYEEEDDRLRRLDQLRALADGGGFTRRPVVFEGYGAARFEDESAVAVARSFAGASPFAVPLRIGRPMTLQGPVDIVLRRESGANVMVVAKATSDVPLGLLVSMAATATVSPARPIIDVVDFTSIDEGTDEALGPLASHERLTISRRSQGIKVIEALALEVDRRVEEDDLRAPARLLFLHGLHRARDLDPEATVVDAFSPAPTDDIVTVLHRILRNGPEVGVHVVAWADTVASLERKLPRAAQREFGQRVAGQMSRDDSATFVDGEMASVLKTHQVVVLDDETGTQVRASTYTPPPSDWLSSLLAEGGR